MRTVFVVSGGDAPGINAALYHFSVLAARFGEQTLGAVGGFPALLEGRLEVFGPRDLLPWVSMSGSRFPSSRVPVLADGDARDRLRAVLAQHDIDALVVFGGDGTLRHIPPLLESWGIPCVGIPTTIDNDVPGTEYTLGFDSACNFALPIIDGIRATGSALEGRIFTLETLGGQTGMLALEIARACGADAVAVPEYDYSVSHLCGRLADAVQQRGQALLVYTEGLPGKEELLEEIPRKTGIRIRSSGLGHAQRGGTPTHRDRAFGAQAALAGYYALKRGMTMGMTLVREGQFVLHEGTLTDLSPKKPDWVQYSKINRLNG